MTSSTCDVLSTHRRSTFALEIKIIETTYYKVGDVEIQGEVIEKIKHTSYYSFLSRAINAANNPHYRSENKHAQTTSS